MPFWMNWIEEGSTVAVTIISIAVMLAAGFLMTRITKPLKLPNVTAYIVSGILCGPYCLNLVPWMIVEGTSFLPDIAVAFIAFSTGEFFRFSSLKRNGGKVFIITALEIVFNNRSNHFEVHLELTNSVSLQDFVTVIRRLGLKIDEIEQNPAYVGSGLSVYSISISVSSEMLKKYKTHAEIIEALKTLDYVYHIEEMRS